MTSQNTPVEQTRCGSCGLLVKEAHQKYSCPRNPRGIPKMVPKNWASFCSHYKSGKPKKRRIIDDDNERIFFTKWLGVRVTPDYRTIVVAKEGFKLKIDPSQTSEQKIVVTSLKERSEVK